jgi:hypothetical protein
MNIYSPIVITEEIVQTFKPARLAVKELNGIKYFCMSTLPDFNKYHGSGKHWKRIVKKYGKKNVKTLWVSDWFYCPHHIQEFALMFSEYNQVVESDTWANIIPENGLTGNGSPDSVTRKKIADANSGKKYSDEVNAKKASHGSLNGMYGVHRYGKESPHYDKPHSEETKSLLKIRAENRECLTCPHCGKVCDASNAKKHHFDNCTKSPLFDPVKHREKKMIGRVCRLDTRKELDFGNWARYIKSLVL